MKSPASSVLRCEVCDAQYAEIDPRTACDCGGLLGVLHPAPSERGAALRARFALRRGSVSRLASDSSGVWRFQELVMPSARQMISHPEGNTPLLTAARVATYVGVRQLYLKHEGHNPTGSFKDRGMTVAITQAVRVGARAVGCASTGNTSASLAAYAAIAGLKAMVLVPEGHVALGKLAQTIAHGARTLAVRGDFDTCLRLMREAQSALGVYLVNSVNPWRIEGQKTIVTELLEQLAWDVPDWIVLPAGNLGNTAAFGKALVEMRDLQLIDRLPRLAAVQAEGAAPFAASFAQGFARRERVEPNTVASAIRIGDPASFDRAVAAIRSTDGVVISVPDEALLDAKATVDASGIGCEPASAASVAGARQLVRQGIVRPEQRVVAVLTGHLLKDPEVVLGYHRAGEGAAKLANPPVTIDPTLRALEQVVFSQ